MENQVGPSNQPRDLEQNFNVPISNTITPELLESLKAQARQNAIRQVLEENNTPPRMAIPQQNLNFPPVQGGNVAKSLEPPQIVYVRRNLTVAELIVVFAISCGLVLGIQGAWNIGSRLLPSIEIKVK
jgi:hypothetical protein